MSIDVSLLAVFAPNATPCFRKHVTEIDPWPA
jgi:hypothetical protein